MPPIRIVLLLCCALVAKTSAAFAQVAEKKSLSVDGAKRVLAAAAAEARRQGAGGAIAVVDDGGHLLVLERLEGTFPKAAEISIGKARTAAVFRRPTKVFEELINKGRASMTALADFTPLQGGVPLAVDGQVVGAIGVSGAASAAADEEIAQAGVKGLTDAIACCVKPSEPNVRYLESAKVAAAFAQGAPLLEVDRYKVHASRREQAGKAEVHRRDTDIIYVLSGTATFVTGGEVVEGQPSSGNEDEIRGASIKDGETRTIAKGDVIVVPAGTPHWFKEVPGPMTYYVVKVTEG
jgi:glc operon protein GlcG